MLAGGHAIPYGTSQAVSMADRLSRESRPAPPLTMGGRSGGRIVFSAGGEIYIMDADGSAPTQLTDGDPNVHDIQPSLSPDGTRIAFSSNRGGDYDIYVMNVDGGDLQRITTAQTTETDPAWSPDGQRLAFVRGFDLTIDGFAYISGCPPEIYVTDLKGGPEINVTKGDGGTDPAWSPDDKRIAFSSHRNGNYEIYVVNADGNDLQQLTNTNSAEADPVWSPDGQFIAYGGDYGSGNLVCGFIHTGRENPVVASGSDIFVMVADGTGQVNLTSSGDSSDPAWSPDGNSIAFVRHRGRYAQIYRMDADGSEQTQLTVDARSKSSPSWSRDSR
jgi:TolB protein